MALRDYFAILWGRKWVIIATVAVTLIVVLIGTIVATPQYQASTTIRVATAAAGSVSYTDFQYADRLLNTYAEIVTSEPILDELRSVLGIEEAPDIIVEILPNTELFQITVDDSNPILAADTANVLAGILISQSTELYSGGGKSAQEILGEQLILIEAELNLARQEYDSLVSDSPEDSSRIEAASRSIELKQKTYAIFLEQYEEARIREAVRANTISIVEPAVIPEKPSSPRILLNIILGLFVGLAGGIGLAFFIEGQDKTLYTSDQIEAVTELSPLGCIPTFKNGTGSSLSSTPIKESFRRLSTQITLTIDGSPLQTLLVTSAEIGEGKSVVVANLAITLAQSNQSVIVVDCDLRRPNLHKNFNLPNDPGLSNVLTRFAEVEDVLQESKTTGLQVITGGSLVTNPAELLGSELMGSTIKELAQKVDIVLLDTPSLLAVSDASLISPLVDGVILIISRGKAREKAVRRVQKELVDIHANLIGVVINRAEQDSSYTYYQR